MRLDRCLLSTIWRAPARLTLSLLASEIHLTPLKLLYFSGSGLLHYRYLLVRIQKIQAKIQAKVQ